MTIRHEKFGLKAGDTRTIRIRVALPGGVNPFDLSGAASAVWVVAVSERSLPGDVLVTKAAGLESALEDGKTFWSMVVDLQPSDTATVDPGTYYQAGKVKDKDGRQFTVEDGPIEIEPSPIPPLT